MSEETGFYNRMLPRQTKKRALPNDGEHTDMGPVAKKIHGLSIQNSGESQVAGPSHQLANPLHAGADVLSSMPSRHHLMQPSAHSPYSGGNHSTPFPQHSMAAHPRRILSHSLQTPTDSSQSFRSNEPISSSDSGFGCNEPDFAMTSRDIPGYQQQYTMMAGYSPDLDCSENPEYYNTNQLLYEAHMNKLRRSNSL